MSTSNYQNLSEVSDQIVENLKAIGVNFLAIDFDQTLVTEHTGGRWTRSAPELLPKVRPIFMKLVPTAIDKGVMVAIVTFSPQVSLIENILKLAYPEHASQIPIRGNDNSWDNKNRFGNGKQDYMASAAEELNRNTNNASRVTRATSFLLDDDANNIRCALHNKVMAIQCDPNNPDRMIAELLNLRDAHLVPPSSSV